MTINCDYGGHNLQKRGGIKICHPKLGTDVTLLANHTMGERVAHLEVFHRFCDSKVLKVTLG